MRGYVTSAMVATLTATVLAAVAMGAPRIESRIWLNGPGPAPDEMVGRPVLVGFWTYDCGNCIETLPMVLELDRRYRDWGLLVIGIHAPEFDHQRSVDRVRAAVRELGITFPVAVDNDLALTGAFGNRHLPGLYLIDPDGEIVFRHAGEMHTGTEPYRELVRKIEHYIAVME